METITVTQTEEQGLLRDMSSNALTVEDQLKVLAVRAKMHGWHESWINQYALWVKGLDPYIMRTRDLTDPWSSIAGRLKEYENDIENPKGDYNHTRPYS